MGSPSDGGHHVSARFSAEFTPSKILNRFPRAALAHRAQSCHRKMLPISDIR